MRKKGFNLPPTPFFNKTGAWLSYFITQVDFEAIHTKHGCIKYKSSLTQMASQNRKKPTMAEQKMWDDIYQKIKQDSDF